jgi:N-acetylglucosaminyldiphosphoundecaprenol N-acetyl-beta-D-mannosaminyltransferase
MIIRLKSLILQIAPLAIFTTLLLALVSIREVEGVVTPLWMAWLIGLAWVVMAMDYLIRFEMFKQIGGVVIFTLGALLLIGALVPLQSVERYPLIASDHLASTFESTWNAVYQGRLFESFSPKMIILDFLRSLESVNLLRGGKMFAFGLLGFLMGLTFMFPISPAWVYTQPGRRRTHLAYWQRCLLVAAVGVIFAVQVELLQILSPSRSVRLFNLMENSLGVIMGLMVYVPVQLGYTMLADLRKRGSARFNVLGVGVDAVDMDDCINRFGDMIATPARGGRPHMTSALGVAGVVEARRNPKLQRILNESSLNTPDGMPLVWLGKLFGYQYIQRVYGPDLLRDLCAHSVDAGWTHYFYGSAPGVAEKLKQVLESKHAGIRVVGTYCPPYRPLTPDEEAELIADVARVKPDIFWVGISTPKQLYFMDHMRDKLACKIICPVGYAFDVNAGIETDAADWIKYAGLQWLHRAIKQPRLWKRYLPDNPRFVWEVLLQILHLRKYPMFLHELPRKPFEDAEGYPRFPAGVVSLSAMSLAEARDRILQWVKTGQRHYVNVCTADTMVQCFDHPALAKIVQESGMATTDGMPLVWLAKYFGFKQATRVYGPDLMLELCRESCKQSVPVRHYFYGATEDTLRKLKENLLAQFPHLEIAGMHAPPFRPLTEAEKQEDADRINTARADIVWCGLGTPKQDYWVAEFRPLLHTSAILAVGAAFDFHAKRIPQAPRWIMNAGLEWLFRLSIEPQRLWRRYIIGNPRFILMVLGRQILGRQRRKLK